MSKTWPGLKYFVKPITFYALKIEIEKNILTNNTGNISIPCSPKRKDSTLLQRAEF